MTILPILLAFVSMVSWGIWAVLVKTASETYGAFDFIIVNSIASLSVAIVYIFATNAEMTLPKLPDHQYILAGIAVTATIAQLSYYIALDTGGKVSVVSTIEGLFFVVAAILGFLFLNDPLGVQKTLGILLAIGAIILLAG